jgi:S-DNA-T family DNA segregation ATPase FtsK/SpoIIIE
MDRSLWDVANELRRERGMAPLPDLVPPPGLTEHFWVLTRSLEALAESLDRLPPSDQTRIVRQIMDYAAGCMSGVADLPVATVHQDLNTHNVLVDPKKVELSLYRVIEKHFLAKLPGEEESIITDTKKVVHTLNALCIEMDNRYDLLKEAGCRNIKEYNEKFTARKLNRQKGHQYLPFIVLVVDEFADLIMTAGKEVEMPIARLAQLARAIGIHLIIATQRPSVNIITGTIKANFPARIAFKVSSKIDSRTILDAGGAEQLIGKGDMLVSYNGEITRLQCAFVDTPEVEKVCEFIGDQRGYPEAFQLPEYVDEKDLEGKDFDANNRDPLFEDAAKLIVQNQMGSTSLIQRRMKLGYNRAGRLMDQLEAAGVVGPNQGSKAREVLFKSDMELQDFLDSMG